MQLLSKVMKKFYYINMLFRMGINTHTQLLLQKEILMVSNKKLSSRLLKTLPGMRKILKKIYHLRYTNNMYAGISTIILLIFLWWMLFH